METSYKHSPNSIHRVLSGGETVIINGNLDRYFGAESTASVIWGMFSEPATVDEVVDQLTSRYQVDTTLCRTETSAFVQDLVDRELLVEV